RITASEFAPALDISGQLTYPSVVSNSEMPEKKLSGSGSLATSCMFNTDILPQLWFIPTLTADYSNTAQPLNVDDSRFLFSEWLDIYLSYGVNYEIMKDWEVKLRGTYRTDFSKQTADEQMGLGLYDYIDSGIYLENVNRFEISGQSHRLTEGLKYIDRQFRNYDTLLSQAAGVTATGTDNPNGYTKEKDCYSYTFYLNDEVQFGKSGWSGYFTFNYDYLPFLEQRVITADGSIGGEKRVDKTGRFSIELPYFYGANNTGMEIKLDIAKNISGQNYYDNLGTTSDFTDDVFTSGFYDSLETLLNIAFLYDLPFGFGLKTMPHMAISFGVENVNYDNRLAQNADRSYTQIKMRENNYTLGLNIKQPIKEWWDWSLSAAMTFYNSNMKYETAGLYNYTYLNVSLGTGLTF
ncbi:MAG: hypothetical protein LLG37_03710, partial [Spirochaetia bacterium]|nr:hypothetical protein [Spirochaetia bacterium]